jgi:glycosyltransferase involved in cell wall biosynthesis
MTRRIDVRIFTPFGAASGMGNWRTAQRYAQMLRSAGLGATIIDPEQFADACLPSGARTVAIALNAVRSAEEIAAFVAHGIPTMVVLTGTDLYGALAPASKGSERYEQAERALHQATLVLTLQAQAQQEVVRRWPELADRTHCLLQTTAMRPTQAPCVAANSKTIRFLIAAHIRPETDPLTAFLAFHRAFPDGWGVLAGGRRVPVRLIHVGGHRDKALADELIRLGSRHPGILLEGPLTHAETLRLMSHVHAMIQPSVSEGGALVVPEAVASRLPVIASNIPAHLGQLGTDYPGLFAVGDVDALARMLQRFVAEPEFQQALVDHTVALASTLASPARERSELVKLVRELAELSPKDNE